MAENEQPEPRSPRREQMEARQRAAEAADHKAAQQAKLKRASVVGVLVLGLLLAVGYVVKETTAPLPGETVADEGRTHVDVGVRVPYNTTPPASGSHYPSPAAWQYYDQPLVPEYYVHNLEHGGVDIVYNCSPDQCPSLVASLKSLYTSLRKSKYGNVKLVVTPDPTLEAGTLWLLAWDHRQKLTSFDQAAITTFYETYVDHGPEDAP